MQFRLGGHRAGGYGILIGLPPEALEPLIPIR